MKISVFGLGYVGSVTAACLSSIGHEAVGVDVNRSKVEAIEQGKSPVLEPGLSELVADATKAGFLRATMDAIEAVAQTDISIVCVGTPSDPSGGQNLKYLGKVAKDIGVAIGRKKEYHLVVVRSTVMPGTTEKLVRPALEVFSGKEAGFDFGLCMNPEFLREGSALKDFFSPSRTVIGELDKESGDLLARLYRSIDAPLIRTELRVAEMVKYADNAFHALKVGFANEIGRICRSFGVDSHKVMEIFATDTKLNLSAYYLRPGFAFGGSCLPKDIRALVTAGRRKDIPLPLLEAVLETNQQQTQLGLELIQRTGKRRIGVLGMTFKPGTDDLRESPMLRLVEGLIGKGYQVKIYDPNIQPDRIMGSNREFVEHTVPHFWPLLSSDLNDVVEKSEVLVLGHRDGVFEKVLTELRPDQEVIDLVRIVDEPKKILNGKYHGIAW